MGVPVVVGTISEPGGGGQFSGEPKDYTSFRCFDGGQAQAFRKYLPQVPTCREEAEWPV